MPEMDVHRSLERLESVVRSYGSLLTAFSGGVDSTLVAVVARRVLGRDAAPAAVGDSPSLPRRELAEAVKLAEQFDLDLLVVHPNEQHDASYQRNSGDRCYYCKTNLYDTLVPQAARRGIVHIANGTNTDDLGDHRPGLTAAAEAQVVSPLVEAGLGKSEVRALAEQLGLPNADKPAAACLASRVPYGTAVTPQVLAQIERAETALQSLGFEGFRVRHHDAVARIEVPMDQAGRLLEEPTRGLVISALKSAGYTYVAVDMEGFRSGSGNALLTVGNRVV